MKRFCFAAAALAATCGAYAQGLQFNPADITIRSADESVTVALNLDGAPVRSDSMGVASFLVDDHNYSRMFAVSKRDGAITIRPTEFVEMGRYDLRLPTEFGTARGVVHVTLSLDPLTLENRAQALDITVDELRRRLGLRERPGREDLRIELPPQYYVGQTLEIALNPEATRDYMWIVNGQIAASGQGPHTFRYLFKAAGDYAIRYQERQGNDLLVDVPLQTQVLDEAPIPWEVSARQKLFLPGPADYDAYLWRVNGVEVSRQATLRYTFDTPGAYTLECIISSDPPNEKYRKITYAVTVR